MMSELFDEEYLKKQYEEAEKRKNIDIGVDKGKSEAKKIFAERLRKKGMSEEQISELTSF